MAITMDSEEQSLVRADSERVLGSGFWPITLLQWPGVT